jgi:hypothetical protein
LSTWWTAQTWRTVETGAFGIRRYVHDLETRCDPAHDVQRMALQADTILALNAKVEN